MKTCWSAGLLLLAGCTILPRPADRCTLAPVPVSAPVAVPRLDHHQHLLNEKTRRNTVEWMRSLGYPEHARVMEDEPLVDADQLVGMLDEVGIRQALVLSSAYQFARSADELPGEYDRVREENDWTLAQVRRHPDRLLAACGVNPRRRYAAAEIERCAASGGFKALKLHLDASGVNLRDAAHLASVRDAFATANRLRLPVVIHLQSEAGYGGAHMRIFLDEVMPEARDIPVTVNHLWGGGGYLREAADALSVFAEAFQRRDPSTSNLWFDLAQVPMMSWYTSNRAQVVQRMRQIGTSRLLYGSDGPQWSGIPPKQHWEDFRACMPLTAEEINAISGNVAPYLR